MTLLDDFARVTHSRPCPVCNHPDWCLVSRADLANPAAALCHRVESKHRWGEAGWFHRLRDDGSWHGTKVKTIRCTTSMAPSMKIEEIALGYQNAVEAHRLVSLSAHLGVTVTSLRRLRIGWTGRAWSFPMSDPRHGDRVVGVRLRLPDGGKYAVKGGKEGLFVPVALNGTGPLLLPEGPTDTAAALDLGFDAVGRPNCSGGVPHTIALVKRLSPPGVVVVADADEPGQRGAATLARLLALHSPDVRVISPPVKDMREWVRAGATAAHVEEAIASAAPIRLAVSVRRAIP